MYSCLMAFGAWSWGQHMRLYSIIMFGASAYNSDLGRSLALLGITSPVTSSNYLTGTTTDTRRLPAFSYTGMPRYSLPDCVPGVLK